MGLFNLCLFVGHQEDTQENRRVKQKEHHFSQGKLIINEAFSTTSFMIMISWGLTLMKRRSNSNSRSTCTSTPLPAFHLFLVYYAFCDSLPVSLSWLSSCGSFTPVQNLAELIFEQLVLEIGLETSCVKFTFFFWSPKVN